MGSAGVSGVGQGPGAVFLCGGCVQVRDQGSSGQVGRVPLLGPGAVCSFLRAEVWVRWGV